MPGQMPVEKHLGGLGRCRKLLVVRRIDVNSIPIGELVLEDGHVPSECVHVMSDRLGCLESLRRDALVLRSTLDLRVPKVQLDALDLDLVPTKHHLPVDLSRDRMRNAGRRQGIVTLVLVVGRRTF